MVDATLSKIEEMKRLLKFVFRFLGVRSLQSPSLACASS